MWGQQRVTFFNSGNRSAVVSGVFLSLSKLQKEAPTDTIQCNEAKPVATLTFDFEPFVIKPGEITVKEFIETLYNFWKTDNTDKNKKIYALGISYFSQGDVALTCLKFTVSTPHETSFPQLIKYSIPIDHISYDASAIPNDGSAGRAKGGIFYSQQPSSIVNKTGTLFSD